MYLRYVKRLLDIGIGIGSLPVLLVVFLAVAPQIKLEDGGPIFYNAPRVGKDGREFIMYKFRSMRVNAPDLVFADGSTYSGTDDPRMTRIGAFMRKTSLDEMPQFINVLKGDMSVVGPRPDLKRETELYQGDEREKLLVKPGVTGYAAAYGRNSLPWHDRLAMDVHYVRNASFAFDAKIFFHTFSTVLKQEGIFAAEEDGANAAAEVAGSAGACADAGAAAAGNSAGTNAEAAGRRTKTAGAASKAVHTAQTAARTAAQTAAQATARAAQGITATGRAWAARRFAR